VSSTGEVLVDYVSAQVRQIEDHEAGVRAAAPDAVHRVRVSARRLRSVLVTYRGAVRTGRVDPLARELKWLAGSLGEARDSEVILDRLVALLAEQPDDLVVGPVGPRLHLELDGRLAAGRVAAVAALDGPRYRELRARLDAFVADPPLDRSAAGPAAQQLSGPLERVLRRLVVRVREAQEADDVEDRQRLLHDVRKGAKRLRYAADLAAPALGDGATALVRTATTLQEVLGQYHDSVVIREALRRLAEQADRHGESTFTYGRLHALEESRAAGLEAAFDIAARELPRAITARGRLASVGC